MTTLLTLEIDQTPHPSLNVNSTKHFHTKTSHKDALRRATAGALQNALTADESLADLLANHRLQMNFAFHWEKYRKKADDDNLKGGPCKVIRDAICTKLERANGDADVVTGEVEQAFPESRQGYVIVEIVSLGTIERIAPTPIVLTQCQAKTAKGARCSRLANDPAVGRLALCGSHRAMLQRDGRIALAGETERAA